MISQDATISGVTPLRSGSNSVVECQLPKLDVTGSIPVSRSNPLSIIYRRFQFKTVL